MLALGRLLELTLMAREPAEKIQVRADGTRLQWRDHGVLEVCPGQQNDNGVDLLVSAGVHGNEVLPLALLDRLLQRIARGQLKPAARVLFILANPQAIRRGVNWIDEDLNRLFRGGHGEVSGTEAIRAAELEQLISGFFADPQRRRVHFDLHATRRASRIARFALCPHGGAALSQHPGLEGLSGSGIETLVLHSPQALTFGAYTHDRFQAASLTLELGTAQADGSQSEPVEEYLARMIAGELAPQSSLDGLQVFQVAQEVICETDNFHLRLPLDASSFMELPKGYLLAEEPGGKRWQVEESGMRLLFPNPRVRHGQRAAILLRSVELHELR